MKKEALDICWLIDVNECLALPFVLYLIILCVKDFSSTVTGSKILGFLLSRCTGPRRNPGLYLEKKNCPCFVVGPSEHKSDLTSFQSEILVLPYTLVLQVRLSLEFIF